MTKETSSSAATSLISKRLLKAMVRAGFTHPDGKPNKRAFARALHENDGQTDLESWERKVYRWTSEKDPGGMNDANAELAAGVLGIPPEELKLPSVLQALQKQHQENDDELARLRLELAQLSKQASANADSIGRIEGFLAELIERLAGPSPPR